MSRRLLVAWAVLASAVLAASCASPRAATQVTVFVDAQPLVRAEARTIEVTILAGQRGELMPLPDDDLFYQAPLSFPMDFVLVPFGDDATRIFEVEARAYDAGRRLITVARLRGAFTEHAARTVRLTLEDACRGIRCGAGQTCRSGACVDLVDPSPDAGGPMLDAGMPDAPPVICDSEGDCDDGNYCNGTETCLDARCQPGAVVDCSDSFECTDDVCMGDGCMRIPVDERCTAAAGGVCDPATGCQYPVCNADTCTAGPCETATCRGTTCVRESRCGSTEECCGGACVPLNCNDGMPCTDDFCGMGAGGVEACQHPSRVGTCNDANACTIGETCDAGARGECGGGTARSCDDTNVCTRDDCDPLVGCANTADDTLPFDDGDGCTVGDTCRGGRGVPGMARDCDDGIACTVDGCAAGVCTHVPMDSRCTASSGGTCSVTAGCQYGTCPAVPCTATDACEVANCVGGVCMRSPRCPGQVCCGGACCVPDGNACTDTACVSGACANVNNAAGCNDGDPCTSGDVCADGRCTASPTCPASTVPCVTTTCAGGVCGSTAAGDGATCSDGNACSSGDTCTAGVCRGTDTVCNDFIACTIDACNPTNGLCTFTAAPEGTSCGPYSMSTCSSRVCNAAGACDYLSMCEEGETCCGRSLCSVGGICN